jgi:hypothetical protein
MFDNRSNILLYNYEVQLDDIVKAICDISFDIGAQIQEIIQVKDEAKGYTIDDMFTEAFIKELSIRPELLSDQKVEGREDIRGLTNEEFFSVIAEYFNRNLFKTEAFLKGLEGSSILLVNKDQGYFLGLGEKAKDRLIPSLKGAKILKNLILNLKSEKIQGSLQKIDMFENDIFYRNTIIASKQESQPLLPFLHKSYLDAAKIETMPVDKDDFWINLEYYKKIGIDLTAVADYEVVWNKEKNKELGVLVGEIIIPYANVDLIDFILTIAVLDYYWLLMVYTYSQRPVISSLKEEQSIIDFKAMRNDVELNHLLSYLKNNFYISDASNINEKFAKFFNSVVFLDKLDFLAEYQFLMSSNIEEETALGVYTTDKKDKDYNLLHWINHNGASKVNHYRSAIPAEKSKKLISALKPAICYYFLKKYFEDFFTSILDAGNYKYFSNHEFFDKGQKSCEIDFFVKTETKFYYFETKTKLSKFYIDEFLKKSSKMMERFKPMIDKGVEIEFILLGGYSDMNVSEYQYFIDESADKQASGYNTTRENLQCKPYYFFVPIPDREGRKITCVAEPEYDKLQNLVKEICQK